MLKDNDVYIIPSDEKHLPFIVKWANNHLFYPYSFSKKKTNLYEQTLRLKEKTDCEFLILNLKDDKIPIGFCQILNIDSYNKRCELRLYIDNITALSKYGVKYLFLLINYIFNRLSLSKIVVNLDIDDSLYIALFKHLGFKNEVRKRQHIFEDGKYKTILELGLLKHEFR